MISMLNQNENSTQQHNIRKQSLLEVRTIMNQIGHLYVRLATSDCHNLDRSLHFIVYTQHDFTFTLIIMRI